MDFFQKWIDKINRIIITLRMSILSIFISLFTVASVILITINYQSSSSDIIFIANKSMHDITKSLNHLFSNEMNLAERDSVITTSLISKKVLDIHNVDQMTRYFYYLAQQFNIVQSIYWGDINGDFISAKYENDNSITSDFFNVSVIPNSDTMIKRDVQGNVKAIVKTTESYDPRKRPWFLDAMAKHRSTWTDIYRYEPSDYLGITYATPVYDRNNHLKGVVGVDIRLDWISWYIDGLKTTPNGILFVVQENGKLIGYPQFDKLPKQSQLIDIHDIADKWVPESFDLYKANQKSSFRFAYEGKNYLATYQPLPKLNKKGWLIGLVIPSRDFTSELNKARNTNIMISICILLMGILFISRLVNNIVNPVKSLIIETNKIKNFDLEGDRRVHSRIKEIILLSDAIYVMKTGLRAFKHYVPSELVRQLIRMGENTKIGGTKKKLVAFFSDIQDFTAIAHESDPDQLVIQLNEYFEALTRIITHERGTVDKYIGDAIMAFWGAPDEIENPCQHAAEAALQLIEQLNILNQKWVNEGKSPFYTRVGIHYGDAIVGNVGSSERINYTAIGDSINIASRLEGINKELNTTILVSETVYDMIKDQFNLHEVGFVTLKGIAEKVRVYELIGRILPSNRSSR